MNKQLCEELTSCAKTNANMSRRPGLSVKDQPLDRVTNIRAWLMVLTWRYTAEASISVFLAIDSWPGRMLFTFIVRTWKCFYK